MDQIPRKKNETLTVYCGEKVKTDRIDPETEVNLSLWGEKPATEVQLRVEGIPKNIFSVLPERYQDLIEIAAYVVNAEKALGGTWEHWNPNSYGQQQSLEFHIPVRQPEYWNDLGNHTYLSGSLQYLTNYNFKFHFYKNSKPKFVLKFFNAIEGPSLNQTPDEICLFFPDSDTLAGVAEKILDEKTSIAFIAEETNRNEELLKKLKSTFLEKTNPGNIPFHVSVFTELENSPTNNSHQNTQLFLHFVVGLAVARMSGTTRLQISQNGMATFQLPGLAENLKRVTSSRSHPNLITYLLVAASSLEEKQYSIDNPLRWKTSGEAISSVTRSGLGELLKDFSSCRNNTEDQSNNMQCGACSCCLDRRHAVLAAQAEHFDPAENYAYNLFLDEPSSEAEKELFFNFISTLNETNRISSFEQFLEKHKKFSGFQYLPFEVDCYEDQLFDLYKRHANEVFETLNKLVLVVRKSKRKFDKGCLLNIFEKNKGSRPSLSFENIEIEHDTFEYLEIDSRRLDTKEAPHITDPPESQTRTSQQVIVEKENEWVFQYAEDTVSLKKPDKGLGYIAWLLSNPSKSFSPAEVINREISAVDIIDLTDVFGDLSETDNRTYSVKDSPSEDKVMITRSLAKKFAPELQDYTKRIEQAKREENLEDLATLEEARDDCLRELVRNSGHKLGSEVPEELSRQHGSITRAINRALQKIENKLPAAANYIRPRISKEKLSFEFLAPPTEIWNVHFLSKK